MSDIFVDNIKHQSSQGSGTITLGASGEKVDLGATAGGTLTNRPAFDVTLSANYYLIKNAPIVSGGSLELIDGGSKIVLASGDQLYVLSDTASSLDTVVGAVDAIST